jgi:hypothetical protein
LALEFFGHVRLDAGVDGVVTFFATFSDMRIWQLFVGFALTVALVPAQVYAQFTDPRTYTNSPVGTNQAELLYGYARSNSSIDSSLVVGGAKFDLNQGAVTYTRYFGLKNHLAWVEPSLPIAGLSGSISGTNISGSITGTGDSSYQFGMLLKGGPALSVSEFENYKPATSIGLSLTVTAPTGTYDQNRLLNLGTSRWSFKPEFGISQPFGRAQRWEIDAYASTYFFTDNKEYRGVEILKQRSLPGLESHLSYSFRDAVWASLDTRFSFLGDTVVDGVNQNNSQRNFIVGGEMNVSLNPRTALVLVFAKAVVHENGTNASGFSVRYDYTWGKGYK